MSAESQNGAVPDALNLPAGASVIMVVWNPETQTAELRFDPTQFKNWQFIRSVLEMGVGCTELPIKTAQTQQIMQAQAELVALAQQASQRESQIRRHLRDQRS
jgi:hypothetical protein